METQDDRACSLGKPLLQPLLQPLSPLFIRTSIRPIVPSLPTNAGKYLGRLSRDKAASSEDDKVDSKGQHAKPPIQPIDHERSSSGHSHQLYPNEQFRPNARRDPQYLGVGRALFN